MGEVAPVAAGLAVGIAFVVTFSIFVGSAFSGSALAKIERISITIDGLKDMYWIGEPVSFTVNTEGISTNLCNDPKPHVGIVNVADNEGVWNSPPTFQTVMGCINPQGFDSEWRFGYPGEELPYESAIGYQPYDNNIVIEKAGLYRMTVEFDDHVIEKEFTIINIDSSLPIYAQQAPHGTKIEVEMIDSQDEVDSTMHSIGNITFDHELDLGVRDQDAHDFAIEVTSDLNEVREFFSTYPNANTTVYSITTCADESCSSLSRIPSVVEYWYKDDGGKYADLRVEINYEEGKSVFSQVRCTIYDTELDGIEMHGAVSLEGVAAFLQDSQCPRN